MKTKDIEVNGVKLRLYKLDAFEQLDLVNTFIPAMSCVLRAVAAGKTGDKNEGIADAVDAFISKIDASARKDLLFNHLLAPHSVKIVTGGVELPLIGEVKTARTVMSDDLSDITYLLQIAAEVLMFNFARFFELGKNTLAHQ